MKKAKKIIGFLGIILTVFGIGSFALAQGPDLGVGFAGNIGLGNSDPRVVIANVIRIALGFLGIIAVLIMMYAGWMWTVSEGEPDKINKAKKILISALIGLLIILSSFAIATFVLNGILSSTTPGPPGPPGPPPFGACTPACGPGTTCCGGVCVPGSTCDTFFVQNTSPVNLSANQILNLKIRYSFNNNVDATTVDTGFSTSTFRVTDGGVDVPGNLTVAGNRVVFEPTGACPANPCGATNCFPSGTTISVNAMNGAGGILRLGDGTVLTCGAGSACNITFDTGNVVDCQDPTIQFDTVSMPQICAVSDNELHTISSDDSGVYDVLYSVDGVLVPNGHPLNPAPTNNPVLNPMPAPSPANFITNNLPGYPSFVDLSTSAGATVNIEATANDLDGHSKSINKNFLVRPGYCCNGVLDGDEEGVDCGGSCASCSGAACGTSLYDSCTVGAGSCQANNDRCASNFCNCIVPVGTECTSAGYDSGVTNCCLCQDAPIIDWVTPEGGFCDGSPNTSCRNNSACSSFVPATCNLSISNGADGNLVTIGGRFFGATVGIVEFNDNSGSGWLTAQLAETINANCTTSWQDDQIIVVQPAGLSAGAGITIRITTAAPSSLVDQTNDTRGAAIDFRVNSIQRPGLCLLSPDNGQINDSITYEGIRLAGVDAKFGNLNLNNDALNSSFLGNTSGTADVPNIANGTTTSFVEDSGGVVSNFLRFGKYPEPASGPYITSFTATSGPIGQYVTIQGSGFGDTQGLSHVYFGSIGVNEAGYDFPDVCSDSVWSDNQVIVKVPSGIADAFYTITMDIGGAWTIDTTSLSPNQFEVDSSLDLLPSACRIQPNLGTAGVPVSIWGEYFDVSAANNTPSFHLNNNQTNVIAVVDGDAQRIDTTVHDNAISGPVKIVIGGRVGNGLNFNIGNCAIDADCGGTDVCCPLGSFSAGRCLTVGASDPYDNCYVDVESAVFEWDFSTDLGSATTTTADSCASLTVNQCVATEFCPNSPGQCSSYLGGAPTVIGTCDSSCNTVGDCTSGTCTYNSSLDRCVNTSQPTCNLDDDTLFDDVNGNDANAYCAVYSGSGRWHFNTPLSCPIGWLNLSGNTCVDPTSSCLVCNSGFVCMNDGVAPAAIGACVEEQDICPGSIATCVANKCTLADSPDCECCCNIADNNPGDATNPACCFPLTCAGSCGSDTTPALPGDTSGFGQCTGCTVDSNGDGAISAIEQSLSDDACNCAGTTGKYCDVSKGGDSNGDGLQDGVCQDCASLPSAQCTAHPTSCCVDGMDGNNCRGGNGTLVVGGFCPYYQCNGTGDACDSANPIAVGPFDDTTSCTAGCNVLSGLDLSCQDRTASTTLSCDVASCSFSCITGGGAIITSTAASDCGTCCCDPLAAVDKCESINPVLDCRANQGSCTGGSRGLCCGCTDDNSCGAANTTGCGLDDCCHAKPAITSIDPPDEPAADSRNVCRNIKITAKFDQEMDPGTFSGNMVVVGDYGADPCPNGTEYFAVGKKPSFFARTIKRLKYLVYTKILNEASAFNSISPVSNYCAIRGSVGGENIDGVGNIHFSPNKPLDPNRRYYSIVFGDKILGDDVHEGVKNYYGVSMGAVGTPVTFNGITYQNVYVSSFTTLDESATNGGICLIDHIGVEPHSYLFQTTANDLNENDADPLDATFDSTNDSDKLYIAEAYADNNQILVPMPGAYDWTWSWSRSNSSVIDFISVAGLPDNKELVRAATAITEGKSLVQAEAVITAGPGASFVPGEAYAYVFLCDNPWPSIDSAGIWEPWIDMSGNCTVGAGSCFNTNFEFYYCRDSGGFGTQDDLPAILDDAVIRGSSTVQNIFKEYYFLREGLPDSSAVSLSGTANMTGNAVDLNWVAVSVPAGETLAGYNIYYGLSSGDYSFSTSTTAVTSATIDGLLNGVTYYFAITALFESGAESDYSDEVIVAPGDFTPPTVPTGFGATAGTSTEISFSWTANTDDTVGYTIYWKSGSSCAGSTPPDCYAGSVDVGDTTSVDLSGFTNGLEYYFAITAYDTSTSSAYSPELLPIAPYQVPEITSISLVGSNAANISWSAIDNVQTYNIRYGNASGGPYPGTESVSLSTNTTITGLTANTTYYFVLDPVYQTGYASPVVSAEENIATPPSP